MTKEIQDKLDAVIAPFQGMIDATNSIPALVDAQEKTKYDEGFKAGQASIILPDPNDPDAKYTQADMDALAVLVRSENLAELEKRDTQIADLGSQVAALQAQVDGIDAKVAEGVAAFKADLKAKYEAQQVAETEGETGFKGLLD